MKKFFTILIIISFILSGCNVGKKKEEEIKKEEQTYSFPTDVEIEKMMNDQLTNPNIVKDDNLLIVGDLGLNEDKKLKPLQNKADENDKLGMEIQGYDEKSSYKEVPIGSTTLIHPTYINPKVQAVNGSYINNVIGKAWTYFGTPYELGSSRTNAKTFDCSDYTRWIHLITLGMDLPKTSATQWEYVKKFSDRKYTSLSQAKRGDLLFFMSYRGWQQSNYAGINVKAQPVAHVGVYIGDGKMLHTASEKTKGVRVDKIAGTHLEYRFIGGGKVVQ